MTIADVELKGALEGFSGELIQPRDVGYDEARRLFNGMIDKRPGLIASCRGVADAIDALNAARDGGFEIAVRGAGHGVAGRATTDGGVMIDLSQMKGVFVDPVKRTARAQAGVTWAELNRETQTHGLAVTGGTISSTGIAGYTLGGGLGWAMPKLGLAADNLLSAEVVTADGRLLTASADEHDDLFWGLRGGGGNFGIVPSFEYRVHPVGPIVTGGLAVHPLTAAGDLFRFYREFTADISDDLGVIAALVHAPDGSGAKLSALAVCHLGPLEQAEAELRPLVEFGSPLDVQIGPMPYVAVNSMLDAGYPPRSFNYWKSVFLEELSDEAVDAMVEQFERCPSPMSLIGIEHFHGAVTRVPLEATAVPHRAPGFNFLMTSVWLDPATSDENVAWTRETYAAMQPFAGDRRYLNYLSEDDSGREVARAGYGPNYDRLVEVKNRYDPTNLFRLNLNVEPTV